MTKRTNMAVSLPQSKEDCALAIATMAQHEQEITLIEAAASEKIAVLNTEAETLAAPHRAKHEALRAAVQAYCEVNRNQLLTGNSKSFKFTTGTVSWVLGKTKLVGDKTLAKALIMTLLKRGYKQCVKTVQSTVKSELNKLPDEVIVDLPGVRRVRGAESFIVKPNTAHVDTTAEPKAEAAA